MLVCFAVEYPECMERIKEVSTTLHAHLDLHVGDEVSRSDLIQATGMGLAYWTHVSLSARTWAAELGFKMADNVTADLQDWLDEASVLCAAHPDARHDPATAVIKTATREGMFQDFRYIDSISDPQPMPPEYDPDLNLSSEYRERIENYIRDVESWHVRQGGERVRRRGRRELMTHLRWLVWKVKEGCSYDRLAEKDAALYETAKRPQKSAIHEAIAGASGVAKLVGVRLNVEN